MPHSAETSIAYERGLLQPVQVRYTNGDPFNNPRKDIIMVNKQKIQKLKKERDSSREDRVSYVEHSGSKRHTVYIQVYDCGCFYIGRTKGSYRYRYKDNDNTVAHRSTAIRVKGDYLTWGSKDYCIQAEMGLIRFAAEMFGDLTGCPIHRDDPERNKPLLNKQTYPNVEPIPHAAISQLADKWYGMEYPNPEPRFYVPPDLEEVVAMSMELGIHDKVRKGCPGAPDLRLPFRLGHQAAMEPTGKRIAERTDDWWFGLFVLQHQARNRCMSGHENFADRVPEPPLFGETMCWYRTPTEEELTSIPTVRIAWEEYQYHELLP